MPTIKSAIKRVEVAERNQNRNKTWRSQVRTVRSNVAEYVKTGDAAQTESSLNEAYSVIDRAVAKGVLHKK